MTSRVKPQVVEYGHKGERWPRNPRRNVQTANIGKVYTLRTKRMSLVCVTPVLQRLVTEYSLRPTVTTGVIGG